MKNFQRILVATDLGAGSSRLLDVAVGFCTLSHAKLDVIHVVEPMRSYEGEAADAEARTAAALRTLEAYLADARKEVPELRATLAEGDPASEIARAQNDGACDLVVVGTHARRGVARLLLGSVAAEIVNKSLVPVLVVPRLPTDDP